MSFTEAFGDQIRAVEKNRAPIQQANAVELPEVILASSKRRRFLTLSLHRVFTGGVSVFEDIAGFKAKDVNHRWRLPSIQAIQETVSAILATPSFILAAHDSPLN